MLDSIHRLARLGAATLLAAVLLPSAGPAGAPADPAAAATKPNIVVIYIDDTAAHDGRLWSDPSLTPTLYDRFVAHGTHFANAIGEFPLCCPARATLLTGLHTHNNGVVTNDARLFDPSVHLGKELKSAGYATMWLGKYLNRTDLLSDTQWTAHGAGWTHFDVFDGVNGAFNSYTLHTKEGAIEYGKYHSTRMVAERFVQRARSVAADKPIFAVLSIYNLHAPNTPMPEFKDDSRCNAMPPWNPPNYNEADVSDKPDWIQAKPLLPYPNGWPMANYCREMLGVDWAAGQVVAELRAQGRLDNTLLVFAADNGMAWGQHRLGQNKNNPYSTPLPLYMSWPARWGDEPRQIDELVSNIDMAPTFCAVGGCAMGPFPTGQTGADGVSLLPLLDGAADNLGRDALLEVQLVPDQVRNWRGLRTTALHQRGRWHYVEWSTGDRELYDLAADPWELENQAGRPDKAGLMSELAARLAQLRIENATRGTIRLFLDALPNHARDFTFSGDLGTFVLDDDADPTLPRSRKVSVPPGTYVVRQAAVAGWSLVNVTCLPTQVVDVAARQVTITVGLTETVECTFVDVLRQPDVSIALDEPGPYKGDNVYTTTGSSTQTLRRDGVPPGTYSFWVRAQNDSLRTDSFTLRSALVGDSNMPVSYWVGTTDVTAALLAGTYGLTLGPASARLLRVDVTVPPEAAPGALRSVFVYMTSQSQPTKVDVVKAIVTR